MTHSADILPRPDRLQPRGTFRGSRRGRWRALVLATVHVVALVHLAHWKVRGTTLTPVEPSESMQTLELGYVNAGFILFGVSILATLVLGRFFCGWMCHFVAYQDACTWLLGRLGLKPRPLRSRLLVLVPFGAAFYMFAWPTVERWWRGDESPDWQLHLTTAGFWDTFPGPVMAVLTILIGGFLLVWWLGSKGFCTYGCPYGAFFGLVDRLAPGRIRVTDACNTCGHCTVVCTSNVRVHQEVAQYRMVVDSGCMKTMDCVSACPNDALFYGFGKPAPVARRMARWLRSSDFSWREELALALLFCAALFATRAAYDRVPFLLALSLAVLTSVAALVGWRLLRRRDLVFQHRALRVDGRTTPAGRAAAVAIVAGLALVAHTGVVRTHLLWGERIAARGSSPAELDDARAQLLRAESLGLLSDGRLQTSLGIVEQRRGDLEAAERHLREAVRIQPGAAGATTRLAEVRWLRGARDEGEALLRELLAAQPGYPPALLRLADFCAARGAWADAESALRELLARYPEDGAARERLRRLEAARPR
ncbi:MAG: 4Fe-4S binding protein [Planctomycetes bacterium]|nr:4Fe-4S binding protein [Planctomycetota bacterium]